MTTRAADRAVTLRAGRRKVTVERAGKRLFPDAGLTKRDVADYYRRIAPVALPHWRGLPLTLRRFPDGIGAEGFFQKHAPDHLPDWIRTARLAKQDGHVEHVIATDPATLVWLAGQGCIEFHLGLAPATAPRRPDRIVFDLDPDGDDFSAVQRAARRVRDLLDELGLVSLVQTTGSRGLHVVVPLAGAAPDPGPDFEATHRFGRRVARELTRRAPRALTDAQRKRARHGRVFIDYLRNAYGQTAVAPYSLRALPGAPVATPLTWDEALRGGLQPRSYHLRNVFRRLGQRDDPWQAWPRQSVAFVEADRALGKMGGDKG